MEVPAGSGEVAVIILTPDGDMTFNWFYQPTSGGSSSSSMGPVGTPVTITGTDLAGTTSVDFGGVTATNLVVNSATSISVDAPDGSGSVPVTVHTPDGASIGSDFTFTPVANTISPGTGAVGTAVTITGTGLGAATSVDFGGTPGTGLVANSVDSITVDSPEGAGTVAVVVHTPGSQATGLSFLTLPGVSHSVTTAEFRPRRHRRHHHRYRPRLSPAA